MADRRRYTATLGFWSLVGLGAGLALGIVGFKTGTPVVDFLATAVRPVGLVWLNALQMAVVPLVILQMLVAISGTSSESSVGSVGRDSMVVILGLWGFLALGSYFLSPHLVRLYSASPEIVETIRESVLVPASALSRAGSGPATMGEWIQNLIPRNALQAVLQGNLIQILIVTVVFGLAVNRLPSDQRALLGGLFRSLSDSVMILVRWILFLTPFGVFSLVVGLASGVGFEAVGLLAAFVAMLYGLHFLGILSLYPVASLLGRVPLVRFAKAALTPQLVGLSTRSSLASIPAQIESGQKLLGFGPTTSGFVIPLCVTLFKARTAFANTLKLFLLAHIFGITVSPAQFLTFIITILLISFTAVGIPNTGGLFRPLPAFLAVGIPIEGYVILEAVKDLSDYGDTLSNTTGQFAAATILSRGDREKKKGDAANAPAPPPLSPTDRGISPGS